MPLFCTLEPVILMKNNASQVPLDLQRNEVIAIVNYMHRLAESLVFNREMGREAARRGWKASR